MKPAQKVFVAIGTIAFVGLAVTGGKFLYGGDDASGARTSSSSSSQSAPATSAAPSNSVSQAPSSSTDTSGGSTSTGNYKDGTYTASQDYYVPSGGNNTVSVTLTVANGTISAVKTNDQYSDGTSSYYVSSFESSVSSDATGQSLSSYSPSRIGGASLTTQAFAQAIDSIRSQAAA